MSIDEKNDKGKGSVAIKKATATAQRVKRQKKHQEEASPGKGEPGARKANVYSQKSISLYEDGNVGLMARKGQIALTFFSPFLLP